MVFAGDGICCLCFYCLLEMNGAEWNWTRYYRRSITILWLEYSSFDDTLFLSFQLFECLNSFACATKHVHVHAHCCLSLYLKSVCSFLFRSLEKGSSSPSLFSLFPFLLLTLAFLLRSALWEPKCRLKMHVSKDIQSRIDFNFKTRLIQFLKKFLCSRCPLF